MKKIPVDLSRFEILNSHRDDINSIIMNVLVFKTTVEDMEGIQQVRTRLDSLVGQGHWNFALDDCDRILRIVSTTICPEMAIAALADCGFECLELQD